MAERRASRRDLFRLFGRTLAEAAGKRLPPDAVPPPVPGPPAPAAEVPVEGGRLVVDLAVHPVVPGSGERFRGPGPAGGEAVLLARVTAEHLAAVGGDCPACGGPLGFDGPRDAVLCPGCGASFRLDGCVLEGAGYLRLRTYLCRRLGPRVEIDLGST